MGWKTLDQMELEGKRVLTRVDLNVPIKDEKISDEKKMSQKIDGNFLDEKIWRC